MSFFQTIFSAWAETPGLYTIFNLDGRVVLDRHTSITDNIIHGWYGILNKQDCIKLLTSNQGAVMNLSMLPIQVNYGN
jgi:hypothetical protein